jgi:DNA-binding NtrC family response regulator
MSGKDATQTKAFGRATSPVGQSPAMQRLRSTAELLGPKSCTVVIRGESGSGKELIARYLHTCSTRRDNPFLAVDCTTLKDTLFESQLFGHVKGAFTGAEQATLGFLRSADGGTLFLDEIGEMPLAIQARLLRCIQDRAVVPLGSSTPIPVDIRIFAATHRDLRAMVKRGEFREDLYYRLNVVQLVVPPLRERQLDISMLAEHYLDYYADLYHESVKRLSPEAMAALEQYAWPGNVRELANLMERLHILASGPVIRPQDLPEDLQPVSDTDARDWLKAPAEIPTLDLAERALIARALTASQGNQTRAAGILSIDRRRLRRKIRLYGLQSITHQQN